MAVRNLTRDAITSASAPPPYMTPADVAAHAAASHVRRVPVPPPYLSPKGEAALDRLLTVVATDRTVTRRSIAQETVNRLSNMDARRMRGADFDALADAQAELARIGGAR